MRLDHAGNHCCSLVKDTEEDRFNSVHRLKAHCPAPTDYDKICPLPSDFFWFHIRQFTAPQSTLQHQYTLLLSSSSQYPLYASITSSEGGKCLAPLF